MAGENPLKERNDIFIPTKANEGQRFAVPGQPVVRIDPKRPVETL